MNSSNTLYIEREHPETYTGNTTWLTLPFMSHGITPSGSFTDLEQCDLESESVGLPQNNMGTKTNTIIVIDDEESMHDSCSQVLSRAGFTVKTAFDGERGMSLVREMRPDLVLLDLKLPGKSGVDVLNEITATDPTIIIVVITGYATVESAVEAMKLGASEFLPKPFTPDELRMIVKRGMEKRHLLVETKRLQEENQRIRENFVSIITHEMRSPLVAVEQYIEVLLGGITGELSPKQHEILVHSKSRIIWLISLVNEWLSMARIHETSILDKLEEVDIQHVLDEALELVTVQAEVKKLRISFDVPGKISSITGNKISLVHLFMNLYSNAIKYNSENGRIDTKVYDESDFVRICVSDTGIGIPQESLPFIFDEFFRVRTIGKQARKFTSETGTGLGLAIVKKIVDAHRGYISVDSTLNQGTCFTVHLPKKQQQNGNRNNSVHEATA
ncbi:MAG: hybrid sensor histidine kinase/response regulator [Candidatus Latescibacteria bacterium]|nr:hybrid sensor histidine kinase/response regulator [Candidatus Latescibacterota bacterium]